MPESLSKRYNQRAIYDKLTTSTAFNNLSIVVPDDAKLIRIRGKHAKKHGPLKKICLIKKDVEDLMMSYRATVIGKTPIPNSNRITRDSTNI